MSKYEGVVLEFTNWEKYNPKRAQKSYGWLRLNNDFATDPKLTGLDGAQMFVLLTLLCEASKNNDGRAKVEYDFLTEIRKVSATKIDACIDFLIRKSILKVAERALHGTTPDYPVLHDTTPTDGRTDGRTDEKQVSAEPEPGGSVVGAISPISQNPRVSEILCERKVPLDTQKAWIDAYPDPPWIEREILKAIAWEKENPAKRKRHFSRFMGRWLSRGWDTYTARKPKTTINVKPIDLDEAAHGS